MFIDRRLVLPKLGLTMTEGAVVEWNVQPGTRFTAGQTVFVVESEKAAVEFEAPADGILHEILVPVGVTVPVGTEIGKWTLEGESGTPAEATQPATAPAPSPASPAAASERQEAPDPFTPTAAGNAARVIATPLARRRAGASGIDLAGVTGTGPRGRVLAADVAATLQARSESRTAAPATLPMSAAGQEPGELVTPTVGQRTMAARVTASKRDIPHFYLGIDVDAGALLALRQSLNALPGRPRTSVTHLLVAAVVEALRRVPSMNRIWSNDAMLQLPTLDVGLAVDTPRGLMSPVVHDLGPQSFFGIVRSVDQVIGRARTASLGTGDLAGAAVTVSNAGMHDVRDMISIIVPGQSAILGVGSVHSCFRPDADERPVVRRELSIMLSADHRLHTGVSALRFLNELKSVLQQPHSLVEGIEQQGSK